MTWISSLSIIEAPHSTLTGSMEPWSQSHWLYANWQHFRIPQRSWLIRNDAVRIGCAPTIARPVMESISSCSVMNSRSQRRLRPKSILAPGRHNGRSRGIGAGEWSSPQFPWKGRNGVEGAKRESFRIDPVDQDPTKDSCRVVILIRIAWGRLCVGVPLSSRWGSCTDPAELVRRSRRDNQHQSKRFVCCDQNESDFLSSISKESQENPKRIPLDLNWSKLDWTLPTIHSMEEIKRNRIDNAINFDSINSVGDSNCKGN